MTEPHDHVWIDITRSSDGTEPYRLCSICGARVYPDPGHQPGATMTDITPDLRILDGLIAVAFDGYWTREPRPGVVEYCRRDGEGDRAPIRFGSLENIVPRYTASVDAALALLERAYPGVWFGLARGRMKAAEPEYACQLTFGLEPIAEAEAGSLPMAIIAAMILGLPEGTMNAAREEVALWFAANPDQTS